jgi:hypothetical protein
MRAVMYMDLNASEEPGASNYKAKSEFTHAKSWKVVGSIAVEVIGCFFQFT